MPKIKSNRGAAKRFKRTANGYKHAQAFKNHILTKKNRKRKRLLKATQQVKSCDILSVRRMMLDAS